MSVRRNAVVLMIGLAAALVGAAGALAAFSPHVVVSADANADVKIAYELGASDDSARSLELNVPLDYIYGFGDVAGSTIGTVTASMNAADQGGAALPFSGAITAGSAAQTISYAGGTSSLSALATACIGGPSSAYWLLNLSGGGQTITLPVFLTVYSLDAPLSATFGFNMTLCLPPPDVAVGTAGRAQLGTKLTALALDLPGLFSYPDGRTLWRLRATPYTPASAAANAAGAVEADTLVDTPHAVTVKTTARPKHKQLVSGLVTSGKRPIGGATVQVRRAGKTIATVKTDSSGRYSVVVKAGAKPAAHAKKGQVDLSCQFPMFGLPCANTRIAGFEADSQAGVTP